MESYLRNSCPKEGGEVDVNEGSSLIVSGHKIVFLNPYSKDPCRITSWTSSEVISDTISEFLAWFYP
jgi:hypothetical protein